MPSTADFADRVKVWWGDPEQDWGLATLEGGDVMPIGNGVVLVGMSERSSRQAITQLYSRTNVSGRHRGRPALTQVTP